MALLDEYVTEGFIIMSGVSWPKMCVGCGTTEGLSEHEHVFHKKATVNTGVSKQSREYSLPAALFICSSCSTNVRKRDFPKMILSLIFFLAIIAVLIVIPIFTGAWLILAAGASSPISGGAWIAYLIIIFVAYIPFAYYQGSYSSPYLDYITIHWDASIYAATYSFSMKNPTYALAFRQLNPHVEVKDDI